MHYSVYRRKRFAQWVDGGFPAVAVIGADDQERQVSAVVMLRGMRRCSDVLPSAVAELICEQLGVEQKRLRGRTYSEAARRLLAAGTVA
jgi:hypothetical protein